MHIWTHMCTYFLYILLKYWNWLCCSGGGGRRNSKGRSQGEWKGLQWQSHPHSIFQHGKLSHPLGSRGHLDGCAETQHRKGEATYHHCPQPNPAPATAVPQSWSCWASRRNLGELGREQVQPTATPGFPLTGGFSCSSWGLWVVLGQQGTPCGGGQRTGIGKGDQLTSLLLLAKPAATVLGSARISGVLGPPAALGVPSRPCPHPTHDLGACHIPLYHILDHPMRSCFLLVSPVAPGTVLM